MVCLVCLVYLVEPDQPDRPDEPERPNEPEQPDKPEQPDEPDKPNKRDKRDRMAGRVVSMKACVWMLIGSLLPGMGISSAMAESTSGQAPGSVSGQPRSSEAAETSSLIVTSDYTIGPEDVLEITVWRNTDLSKVVAVRPDGRSSLPLLEM